MKRATASVRPVFRFHRAKAADSETDRRPVDPQPPVAHRDAIARQADDALDPDLRPVAGPAKYHHIAALRQRAENPLCIRQRHEIRQRR